MHQILFALPENEANELAKSGGGDKIDCLIVTVAIGAATGGVGLLDISLCLVDI